MLSLNKPEKTSRNPVPNSFAINAGEGQWQDINMTLL